MTTLQTGKDTQLAFPCFIIRMERMKGSEPSYQAVETMYFLYMAPRLFRPMHFKLKP